MFSCDQCQPQMLPFVYDLLEPDERQAVETHLRGCPACQTALAQAREQAGLLAEAVKERHADVKFQAPAATPASTAPTLVMPRVGPARRPFFLNRWAVAASLLLFVFSAVGVVSYVRYRLQLENVADMDGRLAKAKDGVKDMAAEVELKRVQAQKDMRAIQEQIDRLLIDWKSGEEKVKKVHDAKQQAQISIIGPRVAMAGGNNRYQIQWEPNQLALSNTAGQQQADLMNQPQKMQVRAILSRTNEVLQERNYLAKANQKVPFDLGQNVPFNPNDPVALEVILEGMGVPLKIRDHLTLAYPEYVTHLATDRPMYRPGETVRFRSLTLDRFTLKPSPDTLSLRYRVLSPNGAELHRADVTSQLVDQDKKPILGPNGQPVHGVGAGEFRLPENLPSGQFTLSVAEANERFPEEKRTFLVHLWQAPQFHKQLTFHRASYGPGELVRVNLKATPILPPGAAGMGAPPGMMGGVAPGMMGGVAPGMAGGFSARIHVSIDGNAIVDQSRNFDANNEAVFDFTLPPNLDKGNGVVTVHFNDGGAGESLTRPIPIAVRSLQIDFYPEGGDLVAGLLNRVYVQARTPLNTPADFQGRIVDDRGVEAAKVRTLADDREPGINQGLALFAFTPERGRTYELKLDSPLGVATRFPLPAVKADGVVLHAPEGVVEKQIPVQVASAGRERELLVGAYCRGRLLDHVAVKVKANEWKELALKPMLDVGGVYRVTVFEKRQTKDDTQYLPVAERLVFRKQSEKVDVSVVNLRESYAPGAKVSLQLEARNERRERVPALAMVAVVDQRMARLADDKTARSMPTHFLLTTEVRHPEDLENADVLLGAHPKAPLALDLLLGSQGWRRFAEQAPDTFQNKGMNSNFLTTAQPVAQALDSAKGSLDQLDQKFVVKFLDLQRDLAKTERVEDGPPEDLERLESRKSALQTLQDQAAATRLHAEEWRDFLLQFAVSGAVVGLLLLAFFLLGSGLRRLADGRPARRFFLTGLCMLVLLFLVSVIGTFFLISVRDGPERNRLAAMLGRARTDARFNGGMINAPKVALDVKAPDDAVAANARRTLAIDLVSAPASAFEPPVGDDPQGPNGVAGPPGIPMHDWDGRQRFPNPQQQRAKDRKRDADPERGLRDDGDYQAILRRQVGRRVAAPAIAQACVVREFAHRSKPVAGQAVHEPGDTVFWHPLLVLADGKADLSFDLSDAATKYDVVVLSHTLDGRLGSRVAEFAARPPFRLEAAAPAEISSGDLLSLPVVVTNLSDAKLDLDLTVRGMQVVGDAKRPVSLQGGKSARLIFEMKPFQLDGVATLRVTGKQAKGASDFIERAVRVLPEGVPATGAASGVLLDQPIMLDMPLSERAIEGTLQAQLRAFPSPLSQMQSALDGLAREPSPGFEHAAAVCELSAAILGHLQRSNVVNPALETECRRRILVSLPKLLACEVADGGFDSASPPAAPKLALSADAFSVLKQVAKFHPVDEAVIDRTKQYLIESRANKTAKDSAVQAALRKALLNADAKDAAGLDALAKSVAASSDPYLAALVGSISPQADLLQQLVKLQRKDGSLMGTTASAAGATGHDLNVETTALAVLAWLRSNDAAFREPADKAVHWLLLQRGASDGFGAPHATTLAIQAIVAHAELNPRETQPGEIVATVQNAPNIADVLRLPFGARASELLTIPIPAEQLRQPGRVGVQISATGNNPFPYTLSWSYRVTKADNPPNAPVRISTKLNKDLVKEGETVKLSAVVENKSAKAQRSAVAVIGLPSGLALAEAPAPLQELVKSGALASWEVNGRELTLRWKELPAGAKRTIELDLAGRHPGHFTGPMSRVQPGADAAQAFWAEPLAIRVEAKE